MSACISRHGEFSEHTLDDQHTCTRCHVLDEDALRAELTQWRELVDANEIERLNAALAAVEQDRARLSDRVTRLENAIVFLAPDGGAEVLARIAAAEPSGKDSGQ